jgi:hypothetical protein
MKFIVSGAHEIWVHLALFQRINKKLRLRVTVKGRENVLLALKMLNHYPQRLLLLETTTNTEVNAPKEIIALFEKLNKTRLSTELMQIAMKNPTIRNVHKILNIQPLLR